MKGPAAGLRYESRGGDPPRVVVYGATLGEVFEHAAEAMFAHGRDLHAIRPTYSRPIVSPGDTVPELLVNWLDELRFVGARDGLVWSWFAVDRLEEGGIQGSASGLPVAEVPPVGEIVTSVRLVSDGVIEVPDGLWVELELTLGPPFVSMG